MSPWLSIVGIGEDGMDGLSPAARTLVETAEAVVGGERHLGLIAPPSAPCQQERIVWSSPLQHGIARLLAMRGRRVTVIATGDPMQFGIGATLADHLDAGEVTVIPHPSAFALAAARLFWPLDGVATLSVHGRAVERVIPHIAPGARLIVLTSDANTPRQIAALLDGRGFGESRMVALAHMGGPHEARLEACARDWSGDVPDFHTLCIECVAGPDAVWHARTGLADNAFQHDGKLTKREVRAAALAKLRPHPGAHLLDIGAGCGSVAIEWMRAETNTGAVALEPLSERRAMMAQNATALGTPDLDIRDGRAPEALADLPEPDAIFIGGGLSGDTIAAATTKLKPGGRLVAHAVTLESEAVLTDAQARHGGDLVRHSVARAEAIGAFRGWRPAMPVTQWAWTKTCAGT